MQNHSKTNKECIFSQHHTIGLDPYQGRATFGEFFRNVEIPFFSPKIPLKYFFQQLYALAVP